MRRIRKIIFTSMVCLLGSSFQVLQASEPQDSVLVQMFVWWNQTFKSEQPFTEEGFSQYFTDDIVFVINNNRSPTGIKSLTERFNKIKEAHHLIEIVLPLKEEFSSGGHFRHRGLPMGNGLPSMPVGVIRDAQKNQVITFHTVTDSKRGVRSQR